MAKAERQYCAKRVFTGARMDIGGHMCGHPATVQADGKWYCKLHSPEGAAAHETAKEARWAEEREANNRKYAIQDARRAVIEAAKNWAAAQARGSLNLGQIHQLLEAVEALVKLEGH